MKIDDLRTELRAADARAEEHVRIDAAKLRARGLRGARTAMTRLLVWLWVEMAINLVAVLWLGDFVASHVRALRFVLAGAALDAMAIAHVVFGARQLAGLQRMDFGGPVVAIQRQLETLRVARIRMTKWTLLLAPLLWIPLLVVTLEGVAGVDAYAVFDQAWLVANVLFGAAFVPAMVWVSKRIAHRFDGSPALRNALRAIAGHSLSSAEAFLAEVARLEECA